MIEQIVFYVFSAMLVASALAVITVRNMVHAALFLVLTFFTSAAIWMLLKAEFLAITLVLVYVGAVMVLFLFVVMMLDINESRTREGFARYLPVAAIVALVMAAQMFLVVGAKNFGFEKFAGQVALPDGVSNTRTIGEVLYGQYLYPFEVAAVILLVAIVAAITLTLRKRPQTRYQDPGRQVLVRRDDRVRMVKMAAETDKKG